MAVACVRRTRSTQPPTPSLPLPSPPKKRRQKKFALPCFVLKYLAAPIPALQNLPSPPSPSVPRLLKSLIRRQPKQSSNRPSSRLFPHLCAGRQRRRRRSRFTTAPELPHLRPRPPHWVVHRQRRPPQPTCLTETDFHRIRCASRRRLPPHRGYFTEHIITLPPPEAVGASPTVSSTAS